MGSTLMNLDRHWRRRHGSPLVHVINVNSANRTRFFSPIKSAFDYFMQFHSDRFRFDSGRMRLENLRPGELPQVSLSKGYEDVETVLETFSGARIRELDELEIRGPVNLRGVTLKGRVRIHNHGTHTLDLSRRSVIADETIET